MAPSVMAKQEPEYSEKARLAKFSGVVHLEFIVNAFGDVNDVRILKGVGLDLDERAVEAVRHWKFAPAMNEEQPVPVYANAEVNFQFQ